MHGSSMSQLLVNQKFPCAQISRKGSSCFDVTISTQKVDEVSIKVKVNGTNQTLFPFSSGEPSLQPRRLHRSSKGVPTGPQLGSVCCCVWSVHIFHCHFPPCVLPQLPSLLLLLLKTTTNHVLFRTWNFLFLEHKTQAADWALFLNVVYMDQLNTYTDFLIAIS